MGMALSMSRYGKGFHLSSHDERDWSIEKLGAALSVMPEEIDNDRFVEQIYDQLATSSCTGWASTRVWHMRTRLQGDMSAPYPSAYDNYSKGRAGLSGSPNAPLIDDGCALRFNMLALAKLGVVPLDKWNDPARVNERVDWELLREASDTRGVQYARVRGAEEIRRAIANGHPVAVGFRVDTSFEDYRGGVWDGPKGADRGGHATALIGFKSGAIRGCNSWNTSWGESGLYWVADHVVETAEAWALELSIV